MTTARLRCFTIGHTWEPAPEAGDQYFDYATRQWTGRQCAQCGTTNEGDPHHRAIIPLAWLNIIVAPLGPTVGAITASTPDARIAWVTTAIIALAASLLCLLGMWIINNSARDLAREQGKNAHLREQLAVASVEGSRDNYHHDRRHNRY